MNIAIIDVIRIVCSLFILVCGGSLYRDLAHHGPDSGQDLMFEG